MPPCEPGAPEVGLFAGDHDRLDAVGGQRLPTDSALAQPLEEIAARLRALVVAQGKQAKLPGTATSAMGRQPLLSLILKGAAG